MRRVLGVSISPRSIRASVIEGGFGRKSAIVHEAVVPLHEGADPNSALAEMLAAWQKEYSAEGAVVGLPIQKFTHQLLEMPNMKRADLRRALDFELEKHLPLPVDEYYFDFVVSPGDEGKSMVLVLAVRRDTVMSVLRIVNDAGLKLIAVRCSSVAAISGLLDYSGEKSLSGLVARIEDGVFEFAGVVKSKPALIKYAPVHERLAIDEIARLNDIYPGPVYFIGDVSTGISEKFNSRKFDFPVSRIIASSGVRKLPLDMNFMPVIESGPSRDYYPFAIGGVTAMAVVLLLVSGAVSYFKDVKSFDAVKERRNKIKRVASGFLEARKKLDSLREDRKILFDTMNRSNVAVKAIQDLSVSLPAQSWLTSFSADDHGKVEIEGFSTDIDALVKALETSKTFSNISFSAPVVTKGNEKRFALKMEMVGL